MSTSTRDDRQRRQGRPADGPGGPQTSTWSTSSLPRSYKADLGIKGDRSSAVARLRGGKPAFDLQGSVKSMALQGRHARLRRFARPHREHDGAAGAVRQGGAPQTAPLLHHRPARDRHVLGATVSATLVEASVGRRSGSGRPFPRACRRCRASRPAGAEFGPPRSTKLLQLPAWSASPRSWTISASQPPYLVMPASVQVAPRIGMVVNEGQLSRRQRSLGSGVPSPLASPRTMRAAGGRRFLEKLRAGMVNPHSRFQLRTLRRRGREGVGSRYRTPVNLTFAPTTSSRTTFSSVATDPGGAACHPRPASPACWRSATLTLTAATAVNRVHDLGAIGPGYQATGSWWTRSSRCGSASVRRRRTCLGRRVIVTIQSQVSAADAEQNAPPGAVRNAFAIKAPIEEGEVEITTIEFRRARHDRPGPDCECRFRLHRRAAPGSYCYISVTGRHGQGPPAVRRGAARSRIQDWSARHDRRPR